MIARPQTVLVTMIMLALFLVACERKAQEETKHEVQISGAGATFPAPLYQKWVEEYVKNHPDKGIFYAPVGSGEGTRRFLKQEVDFAGSDAALTDEEIG